MWRAEGGGAKEGGDGRVIRERKKREWWSVHGDQGAPESDVF